jgi:hypothetical protein
MPGIEFFSDKE